LVGTVHSCAQPDAQECPDTSMRITSSYDEEENSASTTGLDPYYRSYLCRSRGCTVSQKTVRETMPAVVRQLPQFRGWPAADGAVFGESADID